MIVRNSYNGINGNDEAKELKGFLGVIIYNDKGGKRNINS